MTCVMLLPPEHPLRDPREASHQLHQQRVHRDRRDHRSQSHNDETCLSKTGDPQLKILRDQKGWGTANTGGMQREICSVE